MKFLRLVILTCLLAGTNVLAQSIPPVQIDSVSVLDDSTVIIKWTPSTDTRVDGYFIYRVAQGDLGDMKFIEPDTVVGRAQSSLVYRDTKGIIDIPSDESLRFYITAFDWDVTPLVQSKIDTFVSLPHQTIFLTQTIDNCNGLVNLSWNEYANTYNGWADGIARYEVYESQNGGPYVLRNIGSSTNYTRKGLMTGIVYNYKIRAVSGDLNKSSTSNRKSLSGVFSVVPSYTYLFNATVASNNRTINIGWLSDTSSIALTYRVYASTDSINYRQVAVIDSATFRQRRELALTNMNAERFSYYLKVVTECSCPDILDTSNIARTIRLKAEYIDQNTNRLTWNKYQGWTVGTGYYELYRVMKDADGNNIQELLETLVDTNQVEYLDFDLDLAGQNISVSYFLKAYEQINDPYNVQSVSQSNFAYVYKNLDIVIPGAFTPNGLNPVFRPRVLSANSNQFSMQIFNRWGKMVFDSKDEFQGWDGKDKDSNQLCLTGSYVYVIKVVDGTGKLLQKVGSVALID